ncbi:MAG: hypothetical protein HYV63_32475 [Candidatus Schekmanbacteria bacterium]|nr:hypothetical protein [Candidatus Schekmanbacteria bacterium]
MSSETKRSASAKNERVLHTRIPEVLETELKRFAESLRVPVSNLVRTILEDVVTAAGAVSEMAEDELRTVARRLAEQRWRFQDKAQEVGAALAAATTGEGARVADRAVLVVPKSAREEKRELLAGVLGFQPLVLAVAARCALCGRRLFPGEQAHLGVRGAPGPTVVIGDECLPKAQAESTPLNAGEGQ